MVEKTTSQARVKKKIIKKSNASFRKVLNLKLSEILNLHKQRNYKFQSSMEIKLRNLMTIIQTGILHSALQFSKRKKV